MIAQRISTLNTAREAASLAQHCRDVAAALVLGDIHARNVGWVLAQVADEIDQVAARMAISETLSILAGGAA